MHLRIVPIGKSPIDLAAIRGSEVVSLDLLVNQLE